MNGEDMDLMVTKICKKCDRIIKKDEKGVTWITFEGKKEIEVIHWHWQCFLDWKTESIENGAKRIYAETMSKVIPQAKGIMNKILYNETPN